jgi:hypothetical protein
MSYLLQLLHSRIGMAIQWLVGSLVGWLTSQVIALGIDLPTESWQGLANGLQLLGAFIVTFAVHWYQAKMAAKVQQVIGATVDSWVGPETLASIQDLAAIAKRVALNSTLPRQP